LSAVKKSLPDIAKDKWLLKRKVVFFAEGKDKDYKMNESYD
jgi:hypothetical protein